VIEIYIIYFVQCSFSFAEYETNLDSVLNFGLFLIRAQNIYIWKSVFASEVCPHYCYSSVPENAASKPENV